MVSGGSLLWGLINSLNLVLAENSNLIFFPFFYYFCTGQLYQKDEEEDNTVKDTKADDAAKVIYLQPQIP